MNMHNLDLYIGSYTDAESHKCIYHCQMDERSGQLALIDSADEVSNPSFLTLSPDRSRLYAVSEGNESAIAAYEVLAHGGLRHLNTQAFPGVYMCNLRTSLDGRFILAANYGDGTVVSAKLLSDGRVGSLIELITFVGSGTNPTRQEGPHAHCAVFDSDGRYALVTDLGTDKIHTFSHDDGHLTPVQTADIQPGEGPRHLLFNRANDRAYLITEMGNRVIAFRYDAQCGALTEFSSVSTLPEGFIGTTTGADIHLSNDEHYIYASNRGHDSIALIRVDRDKLTLAETFPCCGRTPRNFALSPDGRFLICANQDSNNVVVFPVDAQSGCLRAAVHEIALEKPVCIQFR